MRRALGIFALVLLAAVAGGVAYGYVKIRTVLSYRHASLDFHHVAFDGLSVNLNGKDRLLEADHLEVAFSLRDLAAGSRRAFGLVAIDADRPHLTVVRYPNGTWNFPFPKKSGQGPSLSFGPFVFTARVRDGSIAIHDAMRADPRTRDLLIDGIEVNANIDQRAQSQYRIEAALVQGGRSYPVLGRGRWDDRAGLELNRWTARSIPLSSLINAYMNSPQFNVTEGSLDDLDAEYNGIAAPGGTMTRRISMSGYLRTFRVYVKNVGAPLRDGHGPIYANDNGISTPRIDASLAGIPIAIAGGIYDLNDPKLWFGIVARGSLARLAQIAPSFAGKNIGGDIALSVLAEGPVKSPLAFIRVDSRHLRYTSFPVDDAHALVAVNTTSADIVDASAHYGSLTVGASGHAVLTSTRPNSEGILHVTGPLQSIPYAAILADDMDLDATVVASGRADAFDVGGVVAGRGRGEALDGLMRFLPGGDGTIGPFLLTRSDGSSVYARIGVNRKTGEAIALVDADRLPIDTHRYARLPGFRIPPLPALSGRVSASAGADVQRKRFTGMGTAIGVSNGAVAMLSGIVESPRYELHAKLVGFPIATALSMTGRKLPYPEGSIDADVHVRGAGPNPAVNGIVSIPIGSVNGLAFREASVDIAGTPQAMRATNGRVTIGSTRIGFEASYANKVARGSIDAPHANLADFNEYFDVADTLAGIGSLATSFTIGPTEIASSGNVALQGLRFRRFDLGTTNARWTTQNGTVSANAAIAGASGRLRLGGTVGLPSSNPLVDTLRRSNLNLSASARGIDLRQYLPLLGLNAPVTGILDADATVRGRYPSIAANASANVTNGTIGRLSAQTLSARLSSDGRRARIESANVVVPHLTIVASGDAGLAVNLPLNVTAHITSDDIGALYDQAMGKQLDVAGTLDSTLRVTGTLRDPAITDTLALDQLRYRRFVVSHAGANIAATRTAATLRNGEVDFTSGRLLASGSAPIGGKRGPLAVSFAADHLGLQSFDALFPNGTKLGGTLDGTVTVGGTTTAPRFGGGLALAGGSFLSPFFKTPLQALEGRITFDGDQIAIPAATAQVGGGAIALSGAATVPSISALQRDLAFHFTARANDASFNVPGYFNGKLDANVAASRTPAAPIQLGGDAAVSHARIPVNALYNPNAPKSNKPPPFNVAFNDFRVDVGRDVRVQSDIIDVGATGSMTIGGTLTSPTLAGAFTSTGGTVNVYHEFLIQSGRVAFKPADGLMPSVDVVAATSIADPPTDITLHITGQVPNLDLGLRSDPPYSRAQILGLLIGVQALGAVPGLPASGSTQSVNAGTIAQSEAESILKAQLTRGIFEPLSSNLSSALGLQSLQLNFAPNNGFQARVAKGLGEHLNAVFGQTFGQVSKQIFGLRYTPMPFVSAQLSYWRQLGSLGFAGYYPSYLEALNSGTLDQNTLTMIPGTGTSGYLLSIQRRYP